MVHDLEKGVPDDELGQGEEIEFVLGGEDFFVDGVECLNSIILKWIIETSFQIVLVVELLSHDILSEWLDHN